MRVEEQNALSKLRLEHGEECLSAAKSLLTSGNYKSAANRAYYAIFHSMRGVLVYDNIDMKHHSGIISAFRRLYIKTGVFSAEMSEIISMLFDARSGSDYDDFYVLSKAEVAEQIEHAEFFVTNVKAYLAKRAS